MFNICFLLIVICVCFVDNVHVCKLHRDLSGLGFSVLTDTQLGLVSIRQVFPTGPAALSGQLRSGDIILSVNNNRLDNLPHSVSNNHIHNLSHSVSYN